MLSKIVQKVSDLLFKLESEHILSGVLRKELPDVKHTEFQTTLEMPKEPSQQNIELLNDAWDKEPLKELHVINGHLVIKQNSILHDLDFLSNLEQVEGSLIIIMNKSLTNLDGLKKLRHIGGDLCIIGNPVLKDLSGLRVAHVGGDLKVFGNPVISYGCTTSITPGGQTLVIAETNSQVTQVI